MRILIYKFSGLVLGVIIVTASVLLANSTVSAQETKPDFTDAVTCSCSIQMTTDNLGKLNGYLVRLDIQYRENQKPRWTHPVRMYRIEDRKKAGEFCISMYKKYFQEEQKHYEALQKQAQREAASRPNHQTEIKKSLRHSESEFPFASLSGTPPTSPALDSTLQGLRVIP